MGPRGDQAARPRHDPLPARSLGAARRQIHFKLDGAHPVGASHHQKIVVIDDRLAFCGGIDMTATAGTRASIATTTSGASRPTTGRRYEPWHDATMAMDGDAARALGELSRERWETAGGEPLDRARDVAAIRGRTSSSRMFRDVDVAHRPHPRRA